MNPYTEAGVKLYNVYNNVYTIKGFPVSLSHSDLLSDNWLKTKKNLLDNLHNLYDDALTQMKDDIEV